MRKHFGQTVTTVAAGLTTGTTSTYTTTTTTAGAINSQPVTGLAAQTATASPTTDASTGAAFVAMGVNKTTVIVYGTKLDSTIQACQGSIESTEVGVTTTAGAFIVPPQFPNLPDNFMPIGYFVVRTAPSASSWTPCSSSWTATGITVTSRSCIGALPDRPQTT